MKKEIESIPRIPRKKSILYILLLIFLGCNQELSRDLAPRDAGRIVSILNQLGVTCSQQMQSNGLVTLLVSTEEKVKAIKVIDTYRLLPQKKKVGEASGFFPSPEADRKKMQGELIEQIEDAIRSFQGVLDARIFLQGVHEPSNTEERLLSSPLLAAGTEVRPSASVIVFSMATIAGSITAEEIKRMVAGATGIALESIHVLFKQEVFEDRFADTVLPVRLQKNGVSPTPVQLLGIAAFAFILGVVLIRRGVRNA